MEHPQSKLVGSAAAEAARSRRRARSVSGSGDRRCSATADSAPASEAPSVRMLLVSGSSGSAVIAAPKSSETAAARIFWSRVAASRRQLSAAAAAAAAEHHSRSPGRTAEMNGGQSNATSACPIFFPKREKKIAADSFFQAKFARVSPTLARGSCPGLGGGSVAGDLDFLAGEKVRAIVSLNESDGDWDRLLAERGMVRLRAPTPDHGCPSDEQMAAVVAFWAAHRAAGAVFVHCNAGQGRTGAVLCCLLAVEAPPRSFDDVVDVLDPVIKIATTSRRGSWLSAKQERFVRRFVARS